MTLAVFYVPTVTQGAQDRPLAEVALRQPLDVRGAEARHAIKSVRLKRGDTIRLVDGVGHRLTGTITGVGPESVEIEPRNMEEVPEPTPRLVLVQALAKRDRAELAVEITTELGVSEILPWIADRSISRWKSQKMEAGRQRWQRVADAAGKQSRRTWFPKVLAPLTSRQTAQRLREAKEDGDLVLVCHEDATTPISRILIEKQAQLAGARSVFVVIGPEGGFSEAETAALRDTGPLVSLGENILRTSTAGAAAISSLNLVLKRW